MANQPQAAESREYEGRAAPAYVHAHVEREEGRSFSGLANPVEVLQALYEKHAKLPDDQQRDRAFEDFRAETTRYKATRETTLGMVATSESAALPPQAK